MKMYQAIDLTTYL